MDDDTGAVVTGRATADAKVVLDRSEAEAQVANMFGGMPEQLRPLPRAPSLPDMLVSGTPAAELLTQTFTSEQLPHLVYPTRCGTQPASPLLVFSSCCRHACPELVLANDLFSRTKRLAKRGCFFFAG